MRHYELLFVVKPTLTEEEVKAKFDFIKSVMEKNSCEIVTVQDMGVKKLAYEIEKFERGHYFVIYYKANPSDIEEVLRNLRLTEEIIRFLNVKYISKKEIANWEKLTKASEPKSSPAKEEKSTEEEPNTQETAPAQSAE